MSSNQAAYALARRLIQMYGSEARSETEQVSEMECLREHTKSQGLWHDVADSVTQLQTAEALQDRTCCGRVSGHDKVTVTLRQELGELRHRLGQTLEDAERPKDLPKVVGLASEAKDLCFQASSAAGLAERDVLLQKVRRCADAVKAMIVAP